MESTRRFQQSISVQMTHTLGKDSVGEGHIE
jgi:hypothetical protein